MWAGMLGKQVVEKAGSYSFLSQGWGERYLQGQIPRESRPQATGRFLPKQVHLAVVLRTSPKPTAQLWWVLEGGCHQQMGLSVYTHTSWVTGQHSKLHENLNSA